MSAVEALQAGLQVLEDEILRLAKQASASQDQNVQDNYWRLAQDLQREARELRLQIKKNSESSPQSASLNRY
jgi:hypothetical protein